MDKGWTVAAEEYDDFGELRGFLPAAPAVAPALCRGRLYRRPISIEAGLGFGLTPGSDKLAVKLMSSDLNGPNNGIFGR